MRGAGAPRDLRVPGRIPPCTPSHLHEEGPSHTARPPRGPRLRPADRTLPDSRDRSHAGARPPDPHGLHALRGAGRRPVPVPSGAHFASWLGLCPDNRISGGKVLSVQTPPREAPRRPGPAPRRPEPVPQPVGPRGFFRRMRAKLGAPKAITTTAHKLARIIYHLVTMAATLRREPPSGGGKPPTGAGPNPGSAPRPGPSGSNWCRHLYSQFLRRGNCLISLERVFQFFGNEGCVGRTPEAVSPGE